ncbi:DedA family protein [Salinibacterium sp. ZJ450]|uniref:DedA family protein n=1 Tax=Salinibacterium sp. ZJ450 TaxID=2708338 RepID=UPI00141ED78C|nr:DedA family protein [Salinibacterium sp. ZJ450]
MDELAAFVVSLAESPWMYGLVLVLTVADAFLVVLPSETLVVALAALSAAAGSPEIVLLVLTAAIGAMLGDVLCYLIGRRIGVTRFRWMRGPRIAAGIHWAQNALDRRAAVLILTARYVPFARIAVNLTAGAMRFPLKRYLPLTVIAGTGWALYNTSVGALFGSWLPDNPVLAVVLSVVTAITLGVTIDYVAARIADRRKPATPPERG